MSRKNPQIVPPTLLGARSERSRTLPDDSSFLIANLPERRKPKLSVDYMNAMGMLSIL
jgi:hypothetical protein